MSDKKVEFMPFHGINEFMLNDYRQQILMAVFVGLDHLSGPRRGSLNGLVRKYVSVPGFRNSAQAPAGVKARAAVSVFERHPDFTAQVLQGWSELNPELRQRVYDFLKAREWEILPADADRAKLPGFLITWPEGQDYDVLGQAYAEMYPGDTAAENDLRLMIVWLANRLPYDMYADDDEEAGEEAEA